MSESKHTPGPWVLDDYAIPERSGSTFYIRSGVRHWAIGAAHETNGCADEHRDISAVEAKANARLIAAAPDLLEAAQKVIDEAARMAMTTRRRKIFDNLAAATAKAEGR